MSSERVQALAHYPEITTFTTDPAAVSRAIDGTFTQPAVEDFCTTRALSDALLLQESAAERITNNGQHPIEEIGFSDQPIWLEGRRDSAHAVRFGALTIRTTNGRTSKLPVALKPFKDDRHRASNEISALIKVPESTHFTAYEPLGAVRTMGGLAIMTRLEPEVVSLDNIDWGRSLTEPLGESFDVINGLRFGAVLLARMHRASLTHNDAQIKNVAVDTSGEAEKIRLIDLETARWRTLKSGTADYQRFMREVNRDITALITSTLKKGLWQANSGQETVSAMKELLIDPYTSFLRHPANKTETFTEEVSEEAAEQAEQALYEL
jgi:hypothetical protein